MLHYILVPFSLLWFILVTLFAWMMSFVPFTKKSGVHQFLYKAWSKAFFDMFHFNEIVHKEIVGKLPEQYILISNHYSGVDTIWLPGKFSVIPLSKGDLKKWPVIGRILKAAGMIFVDRNEARSRVKSVDNIRRTLENGSNVLIFPEGGCHGRFLFPFKDGAFAISKSTNIPIVPAYLYYEDEDTYEIRNSEGIDYMLNCLLKRKNNRIHLHILKPLFPADFEDVKSFKEHTVELYMELQSSYK